MNTDQRKEIVLAQDTAKSAYQKILDGLLEVLLVENKNKKLSNQNEFLRNAKKELDRAYRLIQKVQKVLLENQDRLSKHIDTKELQKFSKAIDKIKTTTDDTLDDPVKFLKNALKKLNSDSPLDSIDDFKKALKSHVESLKKRASSSLSDIDRGKSIDTSNNIEKNDKDTKTDTKINEDISKKSTTANLANTNTPGGHGKLTLKGGLAGAAIFGAEVVATGNFESIVDGAKGLANDVMDGNFGSISKSVSGAVIGEKSTSAVVDDLDGALKSFQAGNYMDSLKGTGMALSHGAAGFSQETINAASGIGNIAYSGVKSAITGQDYKREDLIPSADHGDGLATMLKGGLFNNDSDDSKDEGMKIGSNAKKITNEIKKA